MCKYNSIPCIAKLILVKVYLILKIFFRIDRGPQNQIVKAMEAEEEENEEIRMR